MYALFTAIPMVGHLNPLLQQAQELRTRGWDVAVASFRDVRGHVSAEAPAVSFVDLGELGRLRDSWREVVAAASVEPSFVRGAMRITRGLWAFWLPMFDGLSQAVAGRRPDVLVVDMFSSAGLCVAEAARLPAVVNNPDLLGALPVSLLPAADQLPFLFTGRSLDQVPWYQRAATGFLRRKLAALILTLTHDRELNAIRRTRGLPPTTAHELLADKRILVNGVFGLEYERPLPPLVSMVGPMLPAIAPELPRDLDEWLRDGPPVVYVNLGTLVVATKEQLARMSLALESNRFRSLWILRPDQAAQLPSPRPSTLRVMEWGPPPLAVLSHPNVKGFVNHCGVNSAYEAMVAGTPMVGIPMCADQQDMALRVADAGAGLWLDKTRFTAPQLRASIERILDEPSFTERIAPIQAAIRASGGISRAADLIEAEVGNSTRGRPTPLAV